MAIDVDAMEPLDQQANRRTRPEMAASVKSVVEEAATTNTFTLGNNNPMRGKKTTLFECDLLR